MIKGILFDMDGVLVDSEEYIFEAAKMMFAEHGVAVKPEDALAFVGTGENSYISGIGKVNGFKVDIERDKARTYQIYEQITVGKLKPFPDVFILADERLGLKPEECLVIEDAVSGIAAGKAAGAKCLALTTSFPADKLSQADWICEHLHVNAYKKMNGM